MGALGPLRSDVVFVLGFWDNYTTVDKRIFPGTFRRPPCSKSKVKLDRSENRGGNRDFILRYRLAGGRIQSGWGA